MAQWMTLLLAVVATTVALTESRVIPAEPISMMLDAYGNPVVFLREKRTPVHPYPHRAMMFTGYYRPVRRSGNGGQATGVFAQGNAVSGQAFFGGMQSPHLKDGPEPIEEPEVSSAEAQAAPNGDESFVDEQGAQPQDEEGYQPQPHHQGGHHGQDEQHPIDQHHHHHHQDGHRHQEDEQHQQDAQPPQEEHEPEPVPVYTTEAAAPVEDPEPSNTESSVSRPKGQHGKKGRKPPVVVDEDDEEDDEAEEDEPVVPFVPFKGNRRRQGYPNLNNFFPMVFSFPGVSTRDGSSGSPPGAVTAIANSYSTGKGGVASSVATAYGGSPNGKKRRTPQSEE